MTLRLTIDLPAGIEERLRRETPDLAKDAKEAYALELFRRGRLGHRELAEVLGLDRVEADAFLQRHRVYEGSLTMKDLDADRATLARIAGGGR